MLRSSSDTITSLCSSSALIRSATSRDRHAKFAAAEGEPISQKHDINHVGHKFPRIRQIQWLEKRLGKSIIQRRQYPRYCREHRERKGAEIANTKANDILVHGRMRRTPSEGGGALRRGKPLVNEQRAKHNRDHDCVHTLDVARLTAHVSTLIYDLDGRG